MFIKFVKIPYIVFRDLFKALLIYIPGGFGNRLRYLYYSSLFKSCGKNVIIDVGVHIEGAELISVGDNVHIDKNCIICTGKKLIGKIKRKQSTDFLYNEGEIIIGSNVHITQGCIVMGHGGVFIGNNCVLSAGGKLYSLTNTAFDLDNKKLVVSIMPYEQANFLISPVVLCDNVWLGLNVVVMPGVVVGKNSFSVTNSVLMGKYPENSYISGQPGQVVRNRF